MYIYSLNIKKKKKIKVSMDLVQLYMLQNNSCNLSMNNVTNERERWDMSTITGMSSRKKS